jgi:hypothetical protein
MLSMTLSRSAIALLLVLVMAPSFALAAGFPTQIVPSDCSGPGGCQSICDLATLAQNILNAGIYLAVFLSAVLFAWAGWKYLSAGGSPGEISAAKSIFWNVGVGLIIILAAWLLVDTLIHTLTTIAAWNSLC